MGKYAMEYLTLVLTRVCTDYYTVIDKTLKRHMLFTDISVQPVPSSAVGSNKSSHCRTGTRHRTRIHRLTNI